MTAKKRYFSLDSVAELVGADIPSDVYMSWDFSETYCYYRKEALNAGKTEEEADEAAIMAESNEQDEQLAKLVRATEKAAETLLGYHDLLLVKTDSKKHGVRYEIKPKHNWHGSLRHIIETINGVGYFHFGSVGELLRSGPYTPKQAGIGHLGWVADYPQVYGESNAKNMVEREMRY